MFKQCGDCKLTLDVSMFHRRGAIFKSDCKNCRSLKAKKFYRMPGVKENQYKKQRLRLSNPDIRQKRLEYQRAKNKEFELSGKALIRRQDPKYKDMVRKIHSRRLKTDIQYKLKNTIYKRISDCIKDISHLRTRDSVKFLGCSILELKEHLESKFQPGMTWENHGLKGWHVDHIMPISKFDLTNVDEFKKVCHYTNLQPLWASDNIRKGNKYAR
jgi:hypothetical protein